MYISQVDRWSRSLGPERGFNMSISTSPAARRAGAEPWDRLLTYDQTVSRTLVHRAAVTEVFLTDGCRVEDTERVLIAAQWPRSHALYEPDTAGFSDPVLLVETVRQAAIYTAHRFHEVPLTHRFIFCDLDFQIEDPVLMRVDGKPLRVLLDGRFTPDTGQSTKRFGARFEIALDIDGQRCGRASVRLLAVGDELYDTLRHRHPVPADGSPFRRLRTLLPPAEVGRVRPENVLLSNSGPGTYEMHLDTGHPGYFEHASDHVPGMALVEAFRQAGHQLLRGYGDPGTRLMTTCEVGFDCFGELDAPITIQGSEGADGAAPGDRPVRLRAVQGERTLARATCGYRPHSTVRAR
ncbi:ScbA/BarX family gamma-butyrolactone biosynthesis protein [Streptomyces mayonensis]|uniref:ScbA/BarX family gamma-butyrolactone biosynthesis protein n=2 Tax=Streptomyces TaxID=1883 RepID=UPI0027E4BBBD|nr:ScbA/BarX family gamma-butyrolactone biosynthesis protein [Streptomyces sp. A108]